MARLPGRHAGPSASCQSHGNDDSVALGPGAGQFTGQAGPRGSQAAPAATAEGSPTEAILALRKHEAATPGVFPTDPAMDPEYWKKPAVETPAPEGPGQITIPPAKLAAVGVFVIVLLALCGMRIWMNRRHPATPVNPVPAPVEALPGSSPHNPRSDENPVASAPLDVDQLQRLSGDGPTYIFATANLNTFTLSINSILQLQNLIQRFDMLEARPADIQLSINTDDWGFTAGAPLTVNSRETQALSAQSAAGQECTIDYSSWKIDNHNPVTIHASLPTSPNALSLHFGFASPSQGEPFRLLIVNENNSPAPIRLGRRWLKGGGDTLITSLQPPLEQATC